MSRPINLVGEKFNRLTVISLVGKDKWGKGRWLCLCSCGKETLSAASDLKMKKKQSCGCLFRDLGKLRRPPVRFKVDPVTKHPLYGVWKGMKARCSNPNVANYVHYGGRGIKVSAEWNKFINFRDDMYVLYMDAISKFGKGFVTLERVDNSQGYNKENCIWATRSENCNNTRRNTYIAINGVIKTSSQWAREYDLKPLLVNKRFTLQGWRGSDCVKPIWHKK